MIPTASRDERFPSSPSNDSGGSDSPVAANSDVRRAQRTSIDANHDRT